MVGMASFSVPVPNGRAAASWRVRRRGDGAQKPSGLDIGTGQGPFRAEHGHPVGRGSYQ